MKILLVENHPHFAKAVTREFFSKYEVVIAASIKEAKVKVAQVDFEFVLSDYDLDDGKGDEFVSYLRDTGDSTPVIAISSHQRGNTALLAAGANLVCSKMEFRKINEVIRSLQT
jgi:DNA-binding response OmpR family regulator